MPNRMAFDKSMRSVDRDGRLRVTLSNISKATVSPYRGNEIPDSELLGLDPGRVYYLLRDPEELAKAAQTFNSIPLLSRHVPVTVDDHQPDLVVGAMGTDAVFNAPYLQNSLIVWEAVAIAGINSEQQCELSCAYRYTADMTPGVYDGVKFDGVMRNLIGNHVALVESGRAGPDVVVADSNPFQKVLSMKLTRTAIAVLAALGAAVRPKMAQDAKLPDFSPLLVSVKKSTLKPEALAKAVHAKLPKLAQDVEMSPEELGDIIEAATNGIDDVELAGDEDETDEEKAERERKEKAAKATSDALPDPSGKEPPKVVSKPAMDAAIAQASAAGEARAIARFNDIRTAEKLVAPFVGEVVAMDSAAAVYKLALDAAGVDLAGVPEAAYGAIVRMLPKPGTVTQTTPRVAMDSSGIADFNKRFPTAVAPARS